MKVSLSKGEGRYVRQAKTTDVFYFVTHFLHVAESKRNFSVILVISLRTFNSADTFFGFYKITLSIFKPSALTHLHGSFFYLFFFSPSWYILGLLDVSLYTYPYNFIKPVTSSYYLYNDGSHNFLSISLLRVWLYIYILIYIYDVYISYSIYDICSTSF